MDLALREDIIIAALKHNNCISDLELCVVASRKWENVLAAIQKPFPALTDLVLGYILGWICTASAVSPVESHSVSGVTGTVLYLQLWNIPHSGFISPEAMATRLSVLTRLKELGLTFKSPRSRSNKPDQGAWRGRRLSLPRCNVLLILIRFRFRGVSEYLVIEDFVARIYAPMLHDLEITLYHQLKFDTPKNEALG